MPPIFSMMASFIILLALFGHTFVQAVTCPVGLAPCGSSCYEPGTGQSCCDRGPTTFLCAAGTLPSAASTSTRYSTRNDASDTTTITTTTVTGSTYTASLDPASSAGNTAVGATGASTSSKAVNSASASSVYTPSAAVPPTPVAGTLNSPVGTCAASTTTVFSTTTVTTGPAWSNSYPTGNLTTTVSHTNGTHSVPGGSVTVPVLSTPTATGIPAPPPTGTTTSVAGTSVSSASGSGYTTQPVPSYDPTNTGSKPVTSVLLSVMVLAAGMMLIS